MAFRHTKRLLSTNSERVKSVAFHPSEPMLAVGMYDGMVQIYNTNTWDVLQSIRVDSSKAVRCIRWVPSLHWLLAAGDLKSVAAFDYNTGSQAAILEEAHSDYIRALAVHPTSPIILSCSDDYTIKQISLRGKMTVEQVYKGHDHFVMDVRFNPRDPSMFASCSLDNTIKFWSLNNKTARFTLKGHDGGVNCITFLSDKERPFIASGSDDMTIRIWDYQQKYCVTTITGHRSNVNSVLFHPIFPILISTSEDETVLVWNTTTFKNEAVFSYGKERGWTIDAKDQMVALGFDNGTVVLQMGKDEVLVSMDTNGRALYTKNSTLEAARLTNSQATDGVTFTPDSKEFITCEVYPSRIIHSFGGRYVTVLGEKRYFIYSQLSAKCLNAGSGQDFCWGPGDIFAVHDSQQLSIYFNIKEEPLKYEPSIEVQRLFGGYFIGIANDSSISFLTWESQTLVRQIDICAKGVWWQPDNTCVAIATDDTLFILNLTLPENFESTDEYDACVGHPDAFEVAFEFELSVNSGAWFGDIFFFSTNKSVCFFTGAEIETITSTEQTLTVLGYIAKTERLILSTKECLFMSYKIPASILNLFVDPTLDIDMQQLQEIPLSWKSRLSELMESVERYDEAAELSDSLERKFSLALKCENYKQATKIARETGSPSMWSDLSSIALRTKSKELLEEALQRGGDNAGLLLLRFTTGDSDGMKQLASKAESNVQFVANFSLGQYTNCIDLLIGEKRYAEAAAMARSYCQERINECVALWKSALIESGQSRLANSIATTEDMPEAFEQTKAESRLLPSENADDVDVDVDELLDQLGSDIDDDLGEN